MQIAFVKYHGYGNDFILIDNREKKQTLTAPQIALLCHRHLGIGADGLILLNEIRHADFQLDFYNADGHPAEMCGNGARCAVAFAQELGIIKIHTHFDFNDTLYTATILTQEDARWAIELDMKDTNVTENKFGYFANTGVPHLVLVSNDIKAIDVQNSGRELRNDPLFAPDGTNVDFIQGVGEKEIAIRTYERGVETETLACGTGATAAALAYAYTNEITEGSIAVNVKYGKLAIHFEREGNQFKNITLTGDAVRVFNGKYKF